MHDTLNSSKFRFTARDGGQGGGSGSGLSTGTIIVIAVVCACVFLLALTLFLWRFFARCFGSRESAPLPPVQELAYHRREQQRAFEENAKAANRPMTWTDAPTHSPYTGSAVSLLTNPEKNFSVYTDEMTAESALPSPNDDGTLYPPNPSFYRASDASSSRNTLAESTAGSQGSLRSAASPSSSPSPSAPLSESMSSTSQMTTMNRSTSGPISRPASAQSRSRVASASRGRRLSQISDSPTTASGFTTRSVSASYRTGAPHRPGNSVQIVLPAPLAAYAGDGQPMYNIPQMSRSSVFADQWLTAGNSDRRSTYNESTDMPRTQSRSRSRHRVTASVPNAPSNPAQSSTFRRAASTSQHSSGSRSRSNTLRKHRPDESGLPDVPPKHSHLSDLAESMYEDDGIRGRSRTQTRLETIPSGQIPPMSSYPPQPQFMQQ